MTSGTVNSPNHTLLKSLNLILDGEFSCNGETGYKPDPTDCSKYYNCIHGNRFSSASCPKGQWFDPSTKVCNWQDKVKKSPCFQCDKTVSTTTATKTTSAPKSGCGMYVYNDENNVCILT